ncbi:MAG: tRNA (adenosine(37)-N6)-threonylcarbamoyltransferase complex dimerization subunit type 1 TsaB [Proteobacteria bacterium]|nr:tRNA (adenosine(37)-N6)-threonylcarbamoyltransferase complex dimerization subunit type 1 TsaB [Pseudomonadota bacterium]
MFVLGVETATWVGSVAVVDEDGLIGECTLNLSATHSGRLLPTIDHMLKNIDIPFSKIDALAVSIGPGSFTGLRIGVSTIKGLAWAEKKPVVGILTLYALAQNCFGSETIICSMLDARKEEVFASLYRWSNSQGPQKLTLDMVISPHKLLQDLLEKDDFLQFVDEKVIFIGDGIERYRSLFEESLGSRAVFAPPHLNHLRAATVAFLGLEEIKKGNLSEVNRLTPVYVRPSDAELHRGADKQNRK